MKKNINSSSQFDTIISEDLEPMCLYSIKKFNIVENDHNKSLSIEVWKNDKKELGEYITVFTPYSTGLNNKSLEVLRAFKYLIFMEKDANRKHIGKIRLLGVVE